MEGWEQVGRVSRGGGDPQEDHTGHGPAQDLCAWLAGCHWTLEGQGTLQESERD